MPALSKTRLLSYLQCPKRLWLEQYSPELEDEAAYDQAAIATGRVVGAMAREVYGAGGGHAVSHDRGLRAAVAATEALLGNGGRAPIFEATFDYDGLTVQVDVLDRSGDRPRIVEVKSSTAVKQRFLADCAIQAWTLNQLGHELKSTSVALIDKNFVYSGDGSYGGLFREVDLTPELGSLIDAMPGVVAGARATLDSLDEPEREIGPHCSEPFPCPFFGHCAPAGRGEPDLEPDGAEAPFVSPELKPLIEALLYPRYFLDFETIAFAIPIWAGTRPYEALPFQWSCHVDDGSGIRHEEFLDLSGEPPMRRAAESLIGTLGSEGPVMVYTAYEKRVLRELGERYPDLEPGLDAIVGRLVDLHPIAKQHYEHPAMQGSWSLKRILPTIGADVDYTELEEVRDGQAAQAAYLEAIHADTPPGRRAALEAALIAYCRLDSLALVRLVEFFGR